MKMHDIHPEQKAVILLLPPLLATAGLMEELLAAHLGDTCRCLIPDLPGHGDDADRPYESAAREAADIRRYLDEQHITAIDLAYGASLGALVLMELLRLCGPGSGITIRRLFFEGASLYENAALLHSTAKRVGITKFRKFREDPDAAREKIGTLYGENVKSVMTAQLLHISEESLSRIIRDATHVRLPVLTPAQQKHCVFAYGEKDGESNQARKICPRKYPHAQLKIWKNQGYCTGITASPTRYAAQLRVLLNS